jgi:hypothetical protein
MDINLPFNTQCQSVNYNSQIMIPQFLVGLTALTVSVAANPHNLSRRGTVASDELVGLAQTIPSGAIGNLYRAYQPDLYVVNGCVPFPGVDADGNTK